MHYIDLLLIILIIRKMNPQQVKNLYQTKNQIVRLVNKVVIVKSN